MRVDYIDLMRVCKRVLKRPLSDLFKCMEVKVRPHEQVLSAVDDDRIGRAFKQATFDLDMLISFEMNCLHGLCHNCDAIATRKT